MKKIIHAIVLAPLLAVSFRVHSSGVSWARAPSDETVFVGHYGEVITLSRHWAAEAVMKGEMEVVRFHLKATDPEEDYHPIPFNPKPTDYVPENFARLRLMQLIVIPKNAPGGLSTLKAIHAAKKAELDAAGIAYKTMVNEYNWSPDSFWVSVSTPYSLWQRYAQSDKNFFILTAGVDIASASRVLDVSKVTLDRIYAGALQDAEGSLSDYLQRFKRDFDNKSFITELPFLLLPWWVVGAIAALLAFVPGKASWLGRVRLIGRGVFVCVGVLQLIFLPILCVGWFTRHERLINMNTLPIWAALLAPLICWTHSRMARGASPRRVFLWTAGASLWPIYEALMLMRAPFVSPETDYLRYGFMELCFALSVIGLLSGLVFGLTHEQKAAQKSE